METHKILWLSPMDGVWLGGFDNKGITGFMFEEDGEVGWTEESRKKRSRALVVKGEICGL